MEPIITYRERCRRCYSCVRACPVKAIKVDQGYAQIIYDRCIGCGNCLACPQNAKMVVDRMGRTQELLATDSPVIAVLGCSFPAFFHSITPGQLVSALKSLGFMEVHEGAYGVRMIEAAYRKAVKKNGKTLLSSHCPAVVDLIERHRPGLLGNLAEIVSPMIAMGRFIKGVLGKDAKVVYLSACIAAKFEVQSLESSGAVDIVLTYQELDRMFKNRGIIPSNFGESPFDGVNPGKGRLFTLSGAPLKAFGISHDLLDCDTIVAEGESQAIDIIRDLDAGRINPDFVDLRFCNGGCIDGPAKDRKTSFFYKRRLIVDYNNTELPYNTAPHYLAATQAVDTARSFSDKSRKLPVPGIDDIKRILNSTNKFTVGDELNCHACGYNTCREHAIAVYQGLADIEMCLPHNLQQVEDDRGRLIQRYELIRRELDKHSGVDRIVGDDTGIKEVLEHIHQVAPMPTTVLIRGETGTGKELTARAIHRLSSRSDKPLVTVNCTTIADSLLESELFGHKKGAFTGAIADKKGLFEAADGGTIFLDEIGDITPKLQAELLRLLDLGEVRPVGGAVAKKVDVRLIAATNKDLELGVREGWFRDDLYYRLNVFTIQVPPLRTRIDAIPMLANYFVSRTRVKLGKNISGIDERVIKAMQNYDWPGNIRELQNIIERALVLTKNDIIRLDNLPAFFSEIYERSSGIEIGRRKVSFKAEREISVSRSERNIITRYLEESGGNVSKAARLAEIPRRTFYRLLSKHGIEPARKHLSNIESASKSQ